MDRFLASLDRMSNILARESKVLTELDLTAMAALAVEKAAILVAISSEAPDHNVSGSVQVAIQMVESEARKNAALLERCIAAQGTVIRLLAAATQSVGREQTHEGTGYGASGHSSWRPSSGLALSARV